MMTESKEMACTGALLSTDGFVSLVGDCLLRQRMSIAELSRRSGISKTRLSRGLNQKSPIDLVALETLFKVLEIDPNRAVLAVCRLRDWRRYHDPDIEIISGLIDELPAQMAAAREGCERVPLPHWAYRRLAEKICVAIAGNDRRVLESRNSFMLDSDILSTRRD